MSYILNRVDNEYIKANDNTVTKLAREDIVVCANEIKESRFLQKDVETKLSLTSDEDKDMGTISTKLTNGDYTREFLDDTLFLFERGLITKEQANTRLGI